MAKHIIVLDTCVLIHDPQALYKFREHDIFVPLAVIDDLDEIKSRPQVGWAAREALRQLDQFDLEAMMSGKGVVINPEKGKLFVLNLENPPAAGESPNIVRLYSDNEIIKAACFLKAKYPNRRVVIVTKDTGLRVRAHAFGCIAENYRNDMIEDEQFKGIRYANIAVQSDSDKLWKQAEVSLNELTPALQEQVKGISPNEFCIFCWGESRCATVFQKDKFRTLKEKSNGVDKGKISFMGIEPANMEQRCAMEVLGDENIPLVTLIGAAGTGKTMISLAVSLDMVNREIYDGIIIIKPLIPVGGKDIGALPGDKFEKISAWLGPMRDNIAQLTAGKGGNSRAANGCFEEMVQEGLIEVEAMAFIQGRSIPRKVVIVDEAQNLTPREARMVVERCGKGSKIIMLGDLSQVENAYLDARSNGLAHAVNGGVYSDKCATVTLTKVERSELAAIASQIFSQPEAQRGR